MNYPLLPLAMIQTGDLLAWRGDKYSTISDKLIKFVKTFTKEDFGHVGIAWRTHDGLDDELLVVEATIPKIRVTRIHPEQELFCVPMNVNWSEVNKAFLLEKIGLPYGLLDAVRAGLGKRVKNDTRWQCAELAHAFYQKSGIRLPQEYTPGAIVRHASSLMKEPVFKIHQKKTG